MSPLTDLLTGDRPFALIRRQDADAVEVYSGAVTTVATLADIPLDPHGPPGPRTLALVPYRQIAERGFALRRRRRPAGVPGASARPAGCRSTPCSRPSRTARCRSRADRGFDISDEEYAEMVGRVLRDEIGRGEGANFVIHRVFDGATVDGDPLRRRAGRAARGCSSASRARTGRSSCTPAPARWSARRPNGTSASTTAW